jgi:shikimate dehydrogenase
LRLELDPALDNYCVMGCPVAHSKSPAIHAAFAAQTGERLVYRAVEVPPGQFAEAVRAFQNGGGKGINVTVPFKQEAWQLCDARGARAARAGAVNTLWFECGRLHGDTTDGAGLVHDLRDNLGCELSGREILILGAGGAVRGVLGELCDERPAVIVIANRTVARAQELARRFAGRVAVEGCGYPALAGRSFPIIINGTSLSLQGKLPPLPAEAVAKNALCYDMMYGDEPTVFMRWAAANGAGRVVDGLGMLVEQAAESFYLWRGVRPETKPVIERLRAPAA